MKYKNEINSLVEFKNNFVEYVNRNPRMQDSDDYHLGLVSDGDEIEEQKLLRQKLNQGLTEIKKLINNANISTNVTYMAGGHSSSIDLIFNLFNLDSLSIPISKVIDLIDQAIGVYIQLEKEYSKNKFNPFWWIGETIRLPFFIFKFAGFNSIKIESNIFAKIYKFLAAVCVLAGGVVAFIEIYKYFKK